MGYACTTTFIRTDSETLETTGVDGEGCGTLCCEGSTDKSTVLSIGPDRRRIKLASCRFRSSASTYTRMHYATPSGRD